MLSTRVAGLSMALLLLLTACASDPDDGIATAGNGGKPGATASPSEADFETQMRAYQNCMADRGVQLTPEGSPPVTTDTSTLEAAMAACRSLSPGNDELVNEEPEELEARRQVAQCMRAAGYTKWPDPIPGNGMWKVPREIDLSDPAVTRAQEDCVRKAQPTPKASS